MSDEQQDNPDSSSSGSGMTSRLASLRASIRASKAAKDEEETTEHESATRPDAPTVSSPTAISSSQSLPAVETQNDEDDDDLDFMAEDTQLISAEDLPSEEETDEPPRPFRDSGENFITGDLHRVRPSSEDPLGEERSDFVAQMDQMSEADDEEGTSGFGDPTVIQSIEDLAFVQGTPLYMSPEQCRDEAADPATDVYSLGVMLFELLEGIPPYVAETVEEVLLMHQDAPIPQQESQFTPPEVRILIARMLAKKPENRPDVAEVIEVLQRHVTVGGADVLGLEEESWSVAEVVPQPAAAAAANVPPMAVGPMQVAHHGDDHTIDSGTEDKLPPIWLVAVIGVVLLLGTIAIVTYSFSVDDEPDGEAEPAVVVADPVEPTKPPPEIVEEPDPEPQDEAPVEPMEFGAADVDAGTPDAGSAADAGPAEEPEVKEAPKPKPKPKKKKRRRRKRRKKPKKEELRELRLEL